MAAFMTEDEFLRALREHPEWRQAVRLEILGEDLLSLPGLVKENSRQIAALAERMERVEAQIAENSRQIAENSRQIAENSRQIAALAGEVKTLANDVGDLKGIGLERELRVGPRQFLRRYRGIRAMSYDERYDMSAKFASESERTELDRLDAILSGNDPDTGKPLYVAVEASWTPNLHDLERARRRAEILSRLSHVAVLALVAYGKKDALDDYLAERARELGVAMARRDLGVTIPAPLIVPPEIAPDLGIDI